MMAQDLKLSRFSPLIWLEVSENGENACKDGEGMLEKRKDFDTSIYIYDLH